MLWSDLDEVTLEDLQGLCEGAPETQSLEFKQQLPPATPEGRQELMKDLCAMANADGGDVVYGIAEAKGQASALKPLTGELPDATKRRVHATLDAIEPRIPGVKTRTIPAEGGHFLVIRVPASLEGPHSYKVDGGARRFVIRNGTSTSDLTMDQLRAAFDRSSSLLDKARSFFEERIHLAERQNRLNMPDGPNAVCVWAPVGGLRGRVSVDIAEQHKNDTLWHPPRVGASIDRMMNLDGLLVTALAGGKERARIQVFRNGCLEGLLSVGSEHQEVLRIPSGVVARWFRDVAWLAVYRSRELGVTGACVFKCALLRIQGYAFAVKVDWAEELRTIDLNSVPLPEVWIEAVEDLEAIEQLDELLRPSLDVLWQAFNFDRCPHYTADGRWCLDVGPAWAPKSSKKPNAA